jgi:hypothetical protein
VSGLGLTNEIAVGGIRKGNAQLANAAETILRASTSREGDSVSISPAARELGATREPDLIDGMVELRAAELTVAASVATLRTADDMARTVLRIAR